MKKNRLFEYGANVAIIMMLAVISITAFWADSVKPNIDKEAYAPIYKGSADKKISLMINVYWGDEYVLPMAQLLKERGFTTTFFIGGSWAAKNVDIVRTLYNDGFELGNHGYNHKNHSGLSYEENGKEIDVTNTLLWKITGNEPVKLFAPPSGDRGDVMHKYCEEKGYKVIMWTRDTIDWRDKDANTVYERAIKNMNSGDLILMHPTAHTLQALPKILDYVVENGYSVAPVSENIG